MNVHWLLRNIRHSWRRRGGAIHFVRRLHWTYADSIPRLFRPREFQIRFCNPSPVGTVDLLVRANRGSDSFILSEVFDHEYYRLDLRFSPSTVLDLGANTGFSAVYFSRHYPAARVVAVEPVPDNLRVLEHNIRVNATAVKIVPAAIAAADGLATMVLGPKDYGHRLLNDGEQSSDRTVVVPAISMPTLMRQLGWDRIGLLKVDVEGYEKVLFASACDWLHVVDAMCIECHDGFGESDLRRLSDRFGFLAPKRLPGIWLLARDIGVDYRGRRVDFTGCSKTVQ